MHRSRRAVLAALGSGLLAGCGSSGTKTTSTAKPQPDQSTPTATATKTQTQSSPTDSGGNTPVQTEAPPDVPPERFYQLGAMRSDYLAARLVDRETIPRLRWWDDYQTRHEYVEPKRDRFLKLTVLFANQGGKDKSLHVPENGEMRAWAGGTTVERLTTLYDGVKKDHVRVPISEDFSIDDVTLNYSTKPLPAGRSLTLSFLFDVPASDTYLVEWDSKRAIEGHEKPVYLGLKKRE